MDVASALGITSSWLCNIEHRRGGLDMSQIKILAALFHCEPRYLLDPPGTPLPAPPPTFTDHVRTFREWQAKELREWYLRNARNDRKFITADEPKARSGENGTKGALHTAR